MTFWEQLDYGSQFTPTKKYLTIFPILLFLMSTHYTHYDLWMFAVNLGVLLVNLVAKLPAMDRVRIFGINKKD